MSIYRLKEVELRLLIVDLGEFKLRSLVDYSLIFHQLVLDALTLIIDFDLSVFIGDLKFVSSISRREPLGKCHYYTSRVTCKFYK